MSQELKAASKKLNCLNHSDPESNSIHIILTVTLSGKVLYISSGCEELLGFQQTEVIGSYIKNYIHEDDQFLVESYFFKNTEKVPCAFRMKDKNGNFYWVSGKIDTVKKSHFDKIEEILFQITFIDMEDDRKRISAPKLEILHKNNKPEMSSFEMLLFNADALTLVEVSPFAVILAKYGKVIYVNEAAKRLLGAKDKEQIIGHTIYDFALEQFHSVIEKRIHSIQDGGRQVGVNEEKWKRLDDFIIDVEVRLLSTFINNNHYEYFVLDDISSRKSFQDILQKSRERYQKIVHNSIDMIAVVFESKWVFINESGVKMFGAKSYTDMLGKDIFTFLDSCDHTRMNEMIKTVLVEKKEVKLKKQSWLTLAGRELYAEQICLPTTYFGEPAVQIIIRDISDRKQAEELMLKSEKLSIAGQLAAGIAHEIRNPLTAIKGFFQLLQTEQKPQYYESIDSELNRIEFILSELLVLAKPTEVQFCCTNIQSVLKDVATLLDTQAILRNIQIQLDFSTQELLIMCDENQLKQVFINLIKNGIDAMPDGGAITITTAISDGNVEIIVRDEGIGIPEELLTKVGEPFYTTKEKGTGLGLMVSYKIIENHQGTITVSSTLNKGTTFKLLLPLYHKNTKSNKDH
ncbi:PAS domain S-box protein [Cytobacillus sp. S13-E01]|uniref:PAS domain S-box protein n=1 Tax=Cytobacillus sp. S13-E01 TaxID=3031326 RepID=UPI0023D7FDCB|nr:PAS domain S-box protein [Cytobacillus sp. S13-E01]MDF0725407.1 PAS domain S-box protein [Cytobacillus sp. S13-E01]